MCKICSKLTIKASEPSQGHRSGVFIIDFEQILQIVLVVKSLTSVELLFPFIVNSKGRNLPFSSTQNFGTYLSIHNRDHG